MPAKALALAVVAVLAAASCGTASPGGVEIPKAAGEVSSTPAQAPSAPPMALKDVPTGYGTSRSAPADISAALAKARADHRPVLLDFGANWCPSCKTMLRVYRDSSVLALLGQYHLVMVDVGRFDRNLATAHRYGLNLERTGIPAFVVLAPSGEVKVVTGNDAVGGKDAATPRRVTTFLGHWWR
ncbi:thioredoxin family protein [Actinomadura gamaensis]|uniref:Thioredoxin family protein n=1 Tax=Actinomadura gamaensis TaxID=1763541 RepID=A0ABV9TQK6_9ACTN